MPGYLADCIRAWRKQLHLSQERLGDKAGMSRSGVNRLESGRHPISESTMERLAAALDVTMAEMCSIPGRGGHLCPACDEHHRDALQEKPEESFPTTPNGHPTAPDTPHGTADHLASEACTDTQSR